MLDKMQVPEYEIQTHIIPRDKDAVVSWLQHNALVLDSPVQRVTRTRSD